MLRSLFTSRSSCVSDKATSSTLMGWLITSSAFRSAAAIILLKPTPGPVPAENSPVAFFCLGLLTYKAPRNLVLCGFLSFLSFHSSLSLSNSLPHGPSLSFLTGQCSHVSAFVLVEPVAWNSVPPGLCMTYSC